MSNLIPCFIIAAIVLYGAAVIMILKNAFKLKVFKFPSSYYENKLIYTQKEAKRIYWLLLAAYVNFFFFVFTRLLEAGGKIWDCIVQGIVGCFLVLLNPQYSIFLVVFLFSRYRDKKIEKRENSSSSYTEDT